MPVNFLLSHSLRRRLLFFRWYFILHNLFSWLILLIVNLGVCGHVQRGVLVFRGRECVHHVWS